MSMMDELGIGAGTPDPFAETNKSPLELRILELTAERDH